MNTKLKQVENGWGPINLPSGAQPAKGNSRTKTLSAVLSPRQTEIVRLVAKGLSDKEIGKTLHLTEGTVGWHLKKIFVKWDVRSRVALTLRFLQERTPKPMPEAPPSRT
jgi:two-component system nitrate/nitrite response regulator NarL